MQIISNSFKTPEQNIALDELLLTKAESGEIGETLRFWSSEKYFVAIGRASKVEEDCITGRCDKDGVQIIRRISGGGTVLQGPGCINYSLILSYRRGEDRYDISRSYERVLNGIGDMLKGKGYNAQFFPVSDLAVDGRKISGNAQSRKHKFFLHHGTFLYDFDLEKVSEYLKHPSSEPEYRKGRSHKDFIANLSISPEKIKEGIISLFAHNAGFYKLSKEDLNILDELVTKKYASDEWNRMF